MPKQKQIASIVPIISTNIGTSRAGWSIDYRALDIVRDIRKQEEMGIESCLELTLPIKIRFSSARSKHGSYGCKRDEQGNLYHRIILVQKRGLEAANETLWHELTHAHQAEAWAKENNNSPKNWVREAYCKVGGFSGESYRNNPYEIQAGQVASLNQFVKLLKGA